MSYEDTLKRFSDGTARVIAQLWEALDLGQLDPADFTELVSLLIGTANAQAASMGQLAFRAAIEATDAAPAAVSSSGLPADDERLKQAVQTVLASDLDTRMQLERLARNEPIQAAVNAFHDQMVRSERVSGWRRQIESDACQLCTWWARDGRVFQTDHPMPRHTGCTCHQVPVIDELTDNFQTTQQAAKTAARNHTR